MVRIVRTLAVTLLLTLATMLGMGTAAHANTTDTATTASTTVTLPEDSEDPAYDCRIHGNHQCGTDMEGQRYVATFADDGSPLSIVVAPGDMSTMVDPSHVNPEGDCRDSDDQVCGVVIEGQAYGVLFTDLDPVDIFPVPYV